MYFPANDGMKLYFNRARVPYKSLKLSKGKYQLLKENSVSKVDAMVELFCRKTTNVGSKYLLAYFGRKKRR